MTRIEPGYKLSFCLIFDLDKRVFLLFFFCDKTERVHQINGHELHKDYLSYQALSLPLKTNTSGKRYSFAGEQPQREAIVVRDV